VGGDVVGRGQAGSPAQAELRPTAPGTTPTGREPGPRRKRAQRTLNRYQASYVFSVMSQSPCRRFGVRASLRMDERDWRIPIEPRSKSKVTSLPLRHADTPIRRYDRYADTTGTYITLNTS
jgi:hypothetical protein